MKPPAAQLRELIAVAPIRCETRAEMLKLIDEMERRAEAELNRRETEYRLQYERLLSKSN